MRRASGSRERAADIASSEGQGTAQIVVEQPGYEPMVIALAIGVEVRLGRSTSVDVTVDDRRVSRVHAVLTFDGDAVIVRDEASSNGTYVGAERIRGARRLFDAATLAIGSSEVVGRITIRGAPRRSGADPAASSDEMIAVDPLTVELVARVRRLAPSDQPVLVRGESGVGKELVARALHRHSPRAPQPFISVNCAALMASLASAALFGHRHGGSLLDGGGRVGLFEEADGGTLMLDEVGDLSLVNQAALLRALEERVITRVGSTRPVPVDVRVIAATRRDLALDVARGRFREDLYARLSAITVEVPPLRERPADIIPIASSFLARSGRAWRLGPGVGTMLRSQPWPGNARELCHVLERGMAASDSDELRAEHLQLTPAAPTGAAVAAHRDALTLRAQMEAAGRQAIVAALEDARWNQSLAARNLAISRRCLVKRMERYGLKSKPGSAEKG